MIDDLDRAIVPRLRDVGGLAEVAARPDDRRTQVAEQTVDVVPLGCVEKSHFVEQPAGEHGRMRRLIIAVARLGQRCPFDGVEVAEAAVVQPIGADACAQGQML
jgi:hypothetical protein